MAKKIAKLVEKEKVKPSKKKVLGIAAAAGAVSLLTAGAIATKIVKSRKAEEEEDLEFEEFLAQQDEKSDDVPYDGPQVIIEAGIMDDLEDNDEASAEKEEAAETQEPDAIAEKTAEEAAEESAEGAVEEPAEEPAGDADEEPVEEPAGDADEEPVEDAVE